jgi:phage-related protein
MGGDKFTKWILEVSFYKNNNGNEPAREWLKALSKDIRKIIGEDIKVVQANWPIGMPLVKNLGKKLWEVRSSIPNGVARVFFILKGGNMVLLHGILKKSQKTSVQDLELARRRMKDLEV